MSEEPNQSRPIVVLDSGLGGLTVVRALQQRLPHEDIVYFGDTARLPYGSKSQATITMFVRQIISFLSKFNPKHTVIACNTATAMAMPFLRTHFLDLAISGVVDPGAKAAVIAAGSKSSPTIGVIATEATVRSRAYAHAIGRRRHHAAILQQPTPLLVPIIEEGRDPSDPLVQICLKQYLDPMISRGIDVLVLGCTHYPILKDAIVEAVGGKIPVIDSAVQCAEDVARRLASCSLLRGESEHRSALKCFVTDDSPRFGAIASRFLGREVDRPEWVSPERLGSLELQVLQGKPALRVAS